QEEVALARTHRREEREGVHIGALVLAGAEGGIDRDRAGEAGAEVGGVKREDGQPVGGGHGGRARGPAEERVFGEVVERAERDRRSVVAGGGPGVAALN